MMAPRRVLPLLAPLILALSASSADAATSLAVDHIDIPQVDYEPAIYYDEGDPLPHLDFARIDWKRIVDKRHRRVVLESDYVRVEVLPEMGRVYSLIDKRTGHDALWKNDIVRPGGANNPTGWWLWIGGIEYTLPGYEHGTTFAMPWTWQTLEDRPERVSMSMATTEPLTGLIQRVKLTVHRGSAALETQIRLHNPGADTVQFAHWVNPMWVPGGENELTDNTEFIIPTASILIADRWQKNLGPSPQVWSESPLRYLRGWKAGDIMADGLTAGYYSAYSHDAEEGVVRVFDPVLNPGVDVWTYGFHPTGIPMGSGQPNKGYVEMWGGTSVLFPDETRPLPPGDSLAWTEWMYSYRETQGMSAASQVGAIRGSLDDGTLDIALSPALEMPNVVIEVSVDGKVTVRDTTSLTPAKVLHRSYPIETAEPLDDLSVEVRQGALQLLWFPITGESRRLE